MPRQVTGVTSGVSRNACFVRTMRHRRSLLTPVGRAPACLSLSGSGLVERRPGLLESRGEHECRDAHTSCRCCLANSAELCRREPHIEPRCPLIFSPHVFPLGCKCDVHTGHLPNPRPSMWAKSRWAPTLAPVPCIQYPRALWTASLPGMSRGRFESTDDGEGADGYLD